MQEYIYKDNHIKEIYLGDKIIYQKNLTPNSDECLVFIPNETKLKIGSYYIFEEKIGESLVEGITTSTFAYPYFIII